MWTKRTALAVLAVVSIGWLLRDVLPSEGARALSRRAAADPVKGPARQTWAPRQLGVLGTRKPDKRDAAASRAFDALLNKRLGMASAPTMAEPRALRPDLMPQAPQLSEDQTRELNRLINGPHEDFKYIGNAANATVKMLASPDLLGADNLPGLGSEQKSRALFARYSKLMRLERPEEELVLAKSETISDRTEVLRFKQAFRGLEIWPSEIVTNVTVDGRLTVLTGAYVPTPVGLDTTPAVPPNIAVEKAWSHVGLPTPTDNADPRLVIYSEAGQAKEIAYEVEVSGGLKDSQVFVSAITGRVIKSISRVCTMSVSGSGVGLTSSTPVPLNLFLSGALYYAIDASKPMYNASAPDITKSGVILILDNNNQAGANFSPLTSGTSTGLTPPDAVSALFNLGITYDFFYTEFGRNSYDNAGASMIAVVRFAEQPGVPMPNAFWNGKYMGFGSADRFAGSLDVIAHEMTHAVVTHSAALVYEGQSGALNESFSDIFGEGAEWKAAGVSDWKIGSVLQTGVLRDMVQPGLHQQPAKMSQYVTTTQDHGGVHINSGIPNRAFYMLVEGLAGGGIGRVKGHQIFYRALTTKLTKQSDFLDLRTATVLCAQELYGSGSTESAKVRQAFDEVEIYEPTASPEAVTGDRTPVSGTDSYLYLYPSGSSYYLARREADLDGAGGTNWISTYPVSSITRPSVSGDGVTVMFVTEDFDFAIALTSSTNGSQQERAGSPGLFNSVALSPNGTKFACIARNADTGIPESKVYLGDLSSGTSEVIDLGVPALDGASSAPFYAVDEIDFSPDGTLLAFDGYQRSTLSDGTVISGWSIYILNLKTRAIYMLFRPTEGYAISRPSFSRIGACRLAFELTDGTDRYVVAWDLMSGLIAEVRKHPDRGIRAYPRYSAADDKTTYTGTYLSGGRYYPVQAYARMSADKVSPDLSSLPVAVEYDGRNGQSYRRGTYAGPPMVTVAALNAEVKGGTTGKFRISRVSGDQSIRVPVDFTPAGSARPGVDYAKIDVFAVIPAGAQHVDVPVSALLPEGAQSRSLTLTIDPKFHYTTPDTPVSATMTLSAATPTFSEWTAAAGLTGAVKNSDDDGDGYTNLFEYALGSNPAAPSGGRQAVQTVESAGQRYLQLGLTRSLVRPGIAWSLERSADMTNWLPATHAIVTDSPSQIVLRDTLPLSGGEKRFIRIKIEEQ